MATKNVVVRGVNGGDDGLLKTLVSERESGACINFVGAVIEQGF